jgi:glycosyltransferase involved in cell wall biosynthesis
MAKLKLSVITPSYNQGQFIEETIQSVLNQEYENLEYFIIDGGSTDNTLEIIKKYENKLTYWASEKDNGQTHAINKGFKMATGDIISWLNSDDVYCEKTLSAVSEYFENHPECQWLAGNLLYMEANGHAYIRKYPNSSKWLEKNAMFSIYQPNVFLRKSILSTIGYPREDFHMTMDYEWYCRIAQKYPVHIFNVDLAKFRFHSQCKSFSAPNTINQLNYYKEVIYIIRKYHSNFAWIINRYPKVVLFFWFRIERIARMIIRIHKNELKKCVDKIR